MRIEGTLTTLSPLTISAPNAGDVYVTLSGRRTAKKAAGAFPATEVSKLSVPAVGEHPEMTVPVINANTLRGQLRRSGASLIEDALIARGEMVRLGTYSALRSGTPYGHPDKAPPTLSEIQAAAEVPPLAVFGGGPRMLTGALRVDTGMPVVMPLIDRGLLPLSLTPMAASSERCSRLSTYLFLRRNDDAATFVDHTLAQHVICDYGASIDAWQTLIGRAGATDTADSDVDEAEDDKGAGMRGLQALTAFEAVLPGTPFAFRMDLDTRHVASLGYALLALARFANAQRLGGYGRLGFGRFRLDVAARTPDGENVPVFEFSESAGYQVSGSNEYLRACVEAAETWLSSISGAALDALMQPSETSREAVRKKLKGSEAEAAFDAVFGK